MNNHNIIINADDFGRDLESTEAIIECFKNGWIDRTTLMVNMPYSGEAVRLAKKEGFSNKVGLHLNLTQGVPITKGILSFSSMCDGNMFKPHLVGCARKVSSELELAIAEEVRAQGEKFLSYQLPLRHFDGHHHVHSRRYIGKIALPILKELGFKSVRNRYTIVGPFWRGIRSRIDNIFYLNLIHTLGLSVSDAFGDWKGGDLTKWNRFDSVEIMVHPHYDERGRLINLINTKERNPLMEELCARL